MTVFGRLAPGATLDMASAELVATAQRLDREIPLPRGRDPLEVTTRDGPRSRSPARTMMMAAPVVSASRSSS